MLHGFLWVVLAEALAVIVLGILHFGVLPLNRATRLAGGWVETVTGQRGPVTIGSYLITSENRGYALVDSGMDTGASAILLRPQDPRCGRAESEVDHCHPRPPRPRRRNWIIP